MLLAQYHLLESSFNRIFQHIDHALSADQQQRALEALRLFVDAIPENLSKRFQTASSAPAQFESTDQEAHIDTSSNRIPASPGTGDDTTRKGRSNARMLEPVDLSDDLIGMHNMASAHIHRRGDLPYEADMLPIPLSQSDVPREDTPGTIDVAESRAPPSKKRTYSQSCGTPQYQEEASTNEKLSPRSAPVMGQTCTGLVEEHTATNNKTMPSTTGTKCRIKGKRKSKSMCELESVKVPISEDVDILQTTSTRDKFFEILHKSDIAITKNNKRCTINIDEQESIEITNFFFNEMFGPPAIVRLRRLVESYNSENSKTVSIPSIVKAERYAADVMTPPAYGNFLNTFTQNEKSKKKNKNGINAELLNLQSVLLNLRQHTDFHFASREAHIDGSGVQRMLKAAGFVTSAGYGWNSCIIDFTIQRFGISRSSFDYSCDSAEVVSTVVDQFGEGIIPVLPLSITTRFRKWGMQKSQFALKNVRAAIQKPYEPLLQLLKQEVYDPMSQGNPITLDTQQLIENTTPLYDTINRAVHNGIATGDVSTKPVELSQRHSHCVSLSLDDESDDSHNESYTTKATGHADFGRVEII